MKEREAWVALASTPGVGEGTFRRLLERFGSAHDALEAFARLPPGRPGRLLDEVLGRKARAGVASAIAASAAQPGRVEADMEALGGWLLTPLDANYPLPLHDLADPPPVIFGLGRLAALEGPAAVAVVGTRHPTGLGLDLAERIAARLAYAGVRVISGLAVGIDAAAHAATLRAGGVTVAVAGSGLDDPAPWANRDLARAIVEQGGAILGELAPGVRPTPGTFPRRNRIISVLAVGTVVVEAPARSGALITARHALEQGRRLLVAPGRPLDPSVAGCLALLRDSPARPLVGLDGLLEDLGVDRSDPTSGGAPVPDGRSTALSEVETAILRVLGGGPRTLDGLVMTTARPPGEVAAALTLLQLRGLVRMHGSLVMTTGVPDRSPGDPGS